MSSGYSGTPLPKKLGIKEGFVVALIDAPKIATKLLKSLPDDVEFRFNGRGKPDLSLVFCDTERKLKKRVDQVWRLAFPDRAVWICWPKKSSKLFVDLTESHIRKHVLGIGLVDIKVCAVNEDWSGLKLMVRRELRGDAK